MSECKTHGEHTHTHGAGCGHPRIEHEGHVDYLHDGHMHHVHGDHVDEHTLSVSAKNPTTCTNGHACGGHPASHRHGPSCGHQAVPHGDHLDYFVDGHLHHVDGSHCDDHGSIDMRA